MQSTYILILNVSKVFISVLMLMFSGLTGMTLTVQRKKGILLEVKIGTLRLCGLLYTSFLALVIVYLMLFYCNVENNMRVYGNSVSKSSAAVRRV